MVINLANKQYQSKNFVEFKDMFRRITNWCNK